MIRTQVYINLSQLMETTILQSKENIQFQNRNQKKENWRQSIYEKKVFKNVQK